MRLIFIILSLVLISCSSSSITDKVIEEKPRDSAINSKIEPSLNAKLASGEYKYQLLHNGDTFYQYIVPDSIPRIRMDKLSVQDSWFIRKKRMDKVQNGYFTSFDNLTAMDNVWFKRRRGRKFMVISLATDHHRTNQIMGRTDMLNDNILDALEVYYNLKTGRSDSLVTREVKKSNFNGLLSKGFKLNATHFTTQQKVQLGVSLNEVIKTYGNPDSSFKNNLESKYFWNYESDQFQQEPYLSSKPLVTNSYGYDIEAFFRGGKLTGLILRHMIP